MHVSPACRHHKRNKANQSKTAHDHDKNNAHLRPPLGAERCAETTQSHPRGTLRPPWHLTMPSHITSTTPPAALRGPPRTSEKQDRNSKTTQAHNRRCAPCTFEPPTSRPLAPPPARAAHHVRKPRAPHANKIQKQKPTATCTWPTRATPPPPLLLIVHVELCHPHERQARALIIALRNNYTRPRPPHCRLRYDNKNLPGA